MSASKLAMSVIFFDVNGTLLDTHALEPAIAEALGGRTDLFPLWMTTLLQSSLVESALERFTDFGALAAAALRIVAAKNGMELSEGRAEVAVSGMRTLPAFPDAKPGLAALRKAGHTLVALTNSGRNAMRTQLEHAKLAEFFALQLSVEEVQVYKPHLRVYRWAAEQAGVAPEQAWMVAAHGWDIAGAKAAHMRTAFVARKGQAVYPILGEPDVTVQTLEQLAGELTTKTGH